MNGNASLPQVEGFTVEQEPDTGATLYRRIDAGTLTTEVELTDRVTCALRLLPTAAVDAILIDHGPDAGPRPADLDLAVRLVELPRAAEALLGLATALEALDHPGSGRLWTVETALRALEVIDLLGLPEADDENGVWRVWETMSRLATHALREIPDPVRTSGGNPLRAAVGPIATRLQDRADRLSAGRLGDLVAGWPVPSDDVADPTDTTMAELEESAPDPSAAAGVRLRERVTRGDRWRDVVAKEDLADVVDLDLTALIRIRLADAQTKVVATRLGVPGHRAWQIRVPVRAEVGAAYRALIDEWHPWLEEHRGRAVEPEGDRKAKLILAFGRLLAATHLPFTLDDFLRSVALVEPAPPHLADVVCLVRAGDAVGPVGLIEDPASDARRVDLVATIPHDMRPSASSVSLVVRADRTPLVTGRKTPAAQRMLALRRLLASHGPEDPRVKGAVDALVVALHEPELVTALRAEVEDAGILSPEVRVLADAICTAEPALAIQLQAAADQRRVDDVERLCAHLSRTRAYLTGLTD